MSALGQLGISAVHLDLGHVAIFRSLVSRAGIDSELEAELFRALQGKDLPDLAALTEGLETGTRDALRLLPSLYGGPEVLDAARKQLPDYPEIHQALEDLGRIAGALQGRV